MQIVCILRSQSAWNRTGYFLFLWILTVLSYRERFSGKFSVQPLQRTKFHGNQQNCQHEYLFIPNSILDMEVPPYLWPSKLPNLKFTTFSNEVQHEIPKFFITFLQISTLTVNSQVHCKQIPKYYLLKDSSTILLPSEATNYGTLNFSHAVQRYIPFFNISSLPFCEMPTRSHVNNQQNFSHYNVKPFQPKALIEWQTISSATNQDQSYIFQNSSFSTSLGMLSDAISLSEFSTSFTMITAIQGDGTSISTSSYKDTYLANNQRFKNTTDTSSIPWVSVHRTTQELQRYSILSLDTITSQSFLSSYGQISALLISTSRLTSNTITEFRIHSNDSNARQHNPDSTSHCTYTSSPALTTIFMERHSQHHAISYSQHDVAHTITNTTSTVPEQPPTHTQISQFTSRNQPVTNFLLNSSASVHIAQSTSRQHSLNFISKFPGNLQHASDYSYQRSINFTTLSSGQQGQHSIITRNRMRTQDLRQYHATTLYMYDTPPFLPYFPSAFGPASYTHINTTQLYVTVPTWCCIMNQFTVQLIDNLRQFSMSSTAYIYSTFDLTALASHPNLRIFQQTTTRSKVNTTVLRQPPSSDIITGIIARSCLRALDDGGQDMFDRLRSTLLFILTVTVLQTRNIIVNKFELSDSHILKLLDWLERLLQGAQESGHAGRNLLVRFSFTFILTLNLFEVILELMLEKFSEYYPVLKCFVSRPPRQPEFTSYLLVVARIAPILKNIDMNLNLTCEPTLSYDKGTAYS